jgi:predicted enzyme related to lactoylglutathione lyase
MSDARTGHFVWHDLMTPETDKGRDFYVQLLGWNTSEMAGGGESITLFAAGEQQLADAVHLDPAQGLPSHWTSYISVADADETVRKAEAHGGKLAMPAFDTPYGRIAILQDPGGAYIHTIAIPEAPADTGSWPPSEGTFCWHELMVPDPEAVMPFYEDLFGWQRSVGAEMGELGTYWLLKRGEQNVAGLMRQPPQVPVPNWQPYIAVDDVDEATARAEALGATVMVPPEDVPGTGRFSILKDPVGAVVALFTAAPM